MILSVSRRTDIPAFFSKWFFNRIEEGKVYVRNPMNFHNISEIDISPSYIDCIVFWTKNPSKEFIDNLNKLDKLNIPYYFQFSITSYNKQIENNVPEKKEIVSKFIELSKKIGKERIIWRYDPILFNETYTLDYHMKYFSILMDHLNKYTEKCIFSFIDIYPKIKKNLALYNISNPDILEINVLTKFMAECAKEHGICLETCCENINLESLGIKKGHCIDNELINKLTNKRFLIQKDKNQRLECGCVESIDIGTYNTCNHNCIYCYANWNNPSIFKYNPDSLLLCSDITEEDIVHKRKIRELKISQKELPF